MPGLLVECIYVTDTMLGPCDCCISLCTGLACRLVECEPDINQWRLQEGDSFAVLASDGLWDVMSDQEAVESVQVVHHTVMTSAGDSSST